MENETPSRHKINLTEVVVTTGFIIFIAAIIWSARPPIIPGRYEESRCMSNLHQLASAMKMYKLDYKDFPDSLCGYVRTKDGEIVDFEDILDQTVSYGNTSSVYPQFIRSIEGFHCPYSPVRRTDSIVEVSENGKPVRYYAYDSYDICTPRRSRDVLKLGQDALRYKKPAKKASDDTVVTWCSYHRDSPQAKGNVIVLFLDGDTRALPAADVEGVDGKGGTRWNTKIPYHY